MAPFTEYLAHLKPTHDAQGDFVRLARADHEMPAVESWAELEAHLVRSKATYAMLDTAKEVWSKYQKALKKDQSA